MIGLTDIVIACDCNRNAVCRPFLLEKKDIDNIRKLLTEQCEFCQERRRYHAHGHRDAKGRFAPCVASSLRRSVAGAHHV